jgi:CMP-N,N'-diacetyllegionaminic acid synthase
MLENNTFLGIIPARGGSKRLPNKNIKKLINKPLIAYTIEAAKDCPYIDELMVTTDSMKIKKIAEKYGVNVPFLRPKHLATDTASSFDTVKHTINFYKYKLNRKFDYFILLQPTSPLRTTKNIDAAMHFLFEKKADAVISISKMEHNPLKSNTVPKNLSLKNFQPDHVKNKRMQDLETYYRENGAIYILNIDRFLREKTYFIKDNIFGYIMKQRHSIDIDTKLDFLFAETIIKNGLIEQISSKGED